jgi:hypothetical protein
MSSSFLSMGVPIGLGVLALASVGAVIYMSSGGTSMDTKESAYLDSRPRGASTTGSLFGEGDNATTISLGGRRRKTKSKRKHKHSKKSRKH